jgi:hemolysin activation/secretion protein
LERVILVRLLLLLAAVAAFAGIAAPQAAFAETPPEPGAIERTIPANVRLNSIGPTLAVPVRELVPRSADHKKFTLGAVNIDGATVFSQQDLSRYFEPYLATEVDQGQLSKMAQAITARYRQTGYLLSYAIVPSQNVEAGMVRLAVVEGRIDKVSVQGAGSAQGAIEAIAAPLVNGAPLRNGALERAIGLIRDFPGVTVTDIALMRSGIEGGRYTLKITVAPDRVRGFSYADNRRTGSIGHSRVYNSVSISSLAVQGDELRVDLFAVPGGHSRYLYGQLLGTVPVGRRGLRLTISGSRGDQYLRSDERFKGKSDNISAQLSYPFLRSRVLTMIGKVSVTDWRGVGTQQGTRRLRDRLRVARAGIEFGNEGKTRFQGELLLSRGLGFGAMTRVGDPMASRPDASGRFTKATAAFQVSRALDERFTLRGTALVQYSDRPLLSAEEFSLGGNRVGRAFDFNARTGDRGAGAGLELGYRLGTAKADRPGVEIFGFADGGVVAEIKSSVTPAQTRALSSLGLGSRFSIAGMSIALETGVPLTGGHRSPRLFASVLRSF